MDTVVMVKKELTFEEFLELIREHIGTYCIDAYWENVYNKLPKKTETYILAEMPYMGINAVATDWLSKNPI